MSFLAWTWSRPICQVSSRSRQSREDAPVTGARIHRNIRRFVCRNRVCIQSSIGYLLNRDNSRRGQNGYGRRGDIGWQPAEQHQVPRHTAVYKFRSTERAGGHFGHDHRSQPHADREGHFRRSEGKGVHSNLRHAGNRNCSRAGSHGKDRNHYRGWKGGERHIVHRDSVVPVAPGGSISALRSKHLLGPVAAFRRCVSPVPGSTPSSGTSGRLTAELPSSTR